MLVIVTNITPKNNFEDAVAKIPILSKLINIKTFSHILKNIHVKNNILCKIMTKHTYDFSVILIEYAGLYTYWGCLKR